MIQTNHPEWLRRLAKNANDSAARMQITIAFDDLQTRVNNLQFNGFRFYDTVALALPYEILMLNLFGTASEQHLLSLHRRYESFFAACLDPTLAETPAAKHQALEQEIQALRDHTNSLTRPLRWTVGNIPARGRGTCEYDISDVYTWTLEGGITAVTPHRTNQRNCIPEREEGGGRGPRFFVIEGDQPTLQVLTNPREYPFDPNLDHWDSGRIPPDTLREYTRQYNEAKGRLEHLAKSLEVIQQYARAVETAMANLNRA
jgi:hypothetical protein